MTTKGGVRKVPSTKQPKQATEAARAKANGRAAAKTAGRGDVRKTLLEYYVYAPVGAGKLAVDAVKGASQRGVRFVGGRRESAMRAYRDLAKRGERVVKGVSRASYTRRAVEQTKEARRNVGAAAKTIRRAVESSANATKAAADATRKAARKLT